MEIANQLSKANLHDSKQSSEIIIGSIRINPKSYTDAFINNPDGGPDIYIEGSQARAAAMEGDIVKVKLNSPSKWKLNRNIIATRWDDWSESLLPLIEQIEVSEKAIESNAQIELDRSVNPESQSPADQAAKDVSRSSRNKRSVPLSAKKNDNKKNIDSVSKIPSNLPAGILKLQVEHVINLPFSSYCIQKNWCCSRSGKKESCGYCWRIPSLSFTQICFVLTYRP